MERKLSMITIFLLMLVTGVFWGTWFTLTRSLENFAAPEFIHIGKTIISNIAWPMRILMPMTIFGIGISVYRYQPKRNHNFYWGLGSLVLIVGVLLITLIVLVPIDNDLKTWTTATIPSNFEEIREKWKTYHAYRTFLCLGSFACFLIFAIPKTDHKTLGNP